MSWAQKRRFTVASLILTPFAIAALLFIILYEPQPTCSDGVRNQDEEGVDCGGVCGNICQDLVPSTLVEWSRLFPVIENYYSVAALVKHPAPSLSARSVPYIFKLYDEKGILVSEHEGVIDIAPSEVFVVFDTGIKTTNRIPVRTTFEFTKSPVWERVEVGRPRFKTERTDFLKGSTGPRVNAQVVMTGRSSVKDAVFIAVLYDSAGIAYQATQTFVERIDENTPITLTFTWPDELPVDPSKVEVYISSYE